MISLKLRTVSFNGTNLPGMPVNCSATKKGWRQELLDLAGPPYRHLVLVGQLVHAQDGDDVAQISVALEDLLDRRRHLVVLVPRRCRG